MISRLLLIASMTILLVVPLNAIPADLLGIDPGMWAIAAAIPGLLAFRPTAPMLAALLCISAALLIGSTIGNGAGPLQTLGLLAMATGCFAAGSALTPRDLRILACLVVALGLLDLIVEQVTGERFWVRVFSESGGRYDRGLDSRVRGLLGHPVYSASLTAGCGAFLLTNRPTASRFWRISLVIIVSTTIFFTGTRSVMLLWVILVAVFAVEPSRQKITRLARVAVVAVAMAFLVVVASGQATVGSDNGARALQITLSDNDDAFVNRRDYSIEFFSQIVDCPQCLIFGAGQYGLTLDNDSSDSTAVGYSDNALLTTTYDYGLGGLALLSGVVVLVFRSRRDDSPTTRALRLAITISLLSWFFFDGQYIFGTLAWTSLMAGRLSRAHRTRHVESSATQIVPVA